MPFFVAIRHQARPDQRDQLLAVIREDFAASARTQRRKFARLFQHVQQPDRLMAFEEWQQRDDFEAHRETAAYREGLAACAFPPVLMPLIRLQYYRHMPHVPAALMCLLLTATPAQASSVEGYVCDDERQQALETDGLVLRAVYRMTDPAHGLILLHGWRTIDHLHRYAEQSGPDTVLALEQRGATLESFACQIAAEFSWLDR
jgi:quinol monooxygenase YgiN